MQGKINQNFISEFMDSNKLTPKATYRGSFWIEDDLENKWQGSLQVQDDSTFYIQLTPPPTLEVHLQMHGAVLLGELAGPINVRLDKCLGVAGQYAGQVRTVTAAFGRLLASRGETRKGKAERLRRTAVWLTELNGWWNVESAHFENGPGGNLNIVANSPRSIVLHDQTPHVALRHLSSARRVPDKDVEATLVIGRPFVVISHAALDLDQVRRELDLIQQFVTLCTGFAAQVERVETTAYATDSKVERFVRGRFFPGWLEDDFRVAPDHHGRLLFQRPVIELGALRAYIKTIYSRFRKIYIDHTLYVETLTAMYFNSSSPDELDFATLVFAAEGFHRDAIGGKYVSRTSYRTKYMKPMRDAIPEHGNADLEKKIFDSLGVCNEKSLKSRLLELAGELPENVKQVLFPDDNSIAFLGKVATTRNYLAHREASLATNSFSVGHELTHGYYKLHAMLVCNLLGRLGAPDHLLEQTASRLLSRPHLRWGEVIGVARPDRGW